MIMIMSIIRNIQCWNDINLEKNLSPRWVLDILQVDNDNNNNNNK